MNLISITAYNSGYARLSYEIRAQLDGSENQVIHIPDLKGRIVSDRINAIPCDSNCIIRDCSVVTRSVPEKSLLARGSTRLIELYAQLVGLIREQAAHDKGMDITKAEIERLSDYLKTIVSPEILAMHENPTALVEELRELMRHYQKAARDLHLTLLDDEAKRRQLQDEITCIEEALQDEAKQIWTPTNQTPDRKLELLNQVISQPRVSTAYDLRLVVGSSEAQEAKILVEVLVSDVQWHPDFEFKFFSHSSKCQVTYKVHVRQYSGLDWEQVPIALTMGNPLESQEPCFPGRPLVDLKSKLVEEKKKRSCVRMAIQHKKQAPAANFREEITQDYSSFQNMLVKLPVGTSLCSSSSDHIIVVDEFDFDYTLYHFVSADSKMGPYRAFAMINSSKWVLESFQASTVYVDGSMVGLTTLATPVPMGTPFIVFAGIDRSVSITSLCDDWVQSKSKNLLTGGSTRLAHTSRLQVTNGSCSSRPITLIVSHRLPQSKNDLVKVTLLDAVKKDMVLIQSPSDLLGIESITKNAINLATGSFIQRITIEAQETAIVEYGYRVEYPSDAEIVITEA